jgi:alkanesulfonate monooxygenase SsuD/methylene tetrahydromethanopterin reductase-like flavin-dependent oxidoreductase (luciferase family)
LNVGHPSRGFAIEAAVDPGIADAVARRCLALGYHSLWTNNPPAALSGLDVAARWLDLDDTTPVGVAVVPLDVYRPEAIAARIHELNLVRERLWLGVGAGVATRPLGLVTDSVGELRRLLPDVRIVLASLGSRSCAVAGRLYDGVFLNWVTPSSTRDSRSIIEAQAGAGGPAAVLAYVRVAVGDGALERLSTAQGAARRIHAGYERHFDRLAAPPAVIGVAEADASSIDRSLATFDGLDQVVVRPVCDNSLDGLLSVAAAAAPRT